MRLLSRVMNRMLGRKKDIAALEAHAEELHRARSGLRESVSALGQDVWGMVETGDPLAALVHGARASQFHRQVEDENGK